MPRPIRLWISKGGEVSVREQLATQLLLAILSKDLKAGQKLPATRELSQRLRIHYNTVSAAYRDLTRRGWVEFRKGSGIYVRSERPPAKLAPELELDRLIADFLESARRKGFALGRVRARLQSWFEMQRPDHFLVIEPDAELREILVAEIQEATAFPVRGAGPEECREKDLLLGAAPVFLFNKAEAIRARVPGLTLAITLQGRSTIPELQERVPIRREALIAVVSAWPEFVKWARTLLAAVGVDPESIYSADPREAGWRRRLRGATAVVTDTPTAKRIPSGYRVHVSRLIADASLRELRELKTFLTRPSL